MAEGTQLYRKRVADGRVPLFISDNSVFFPEEEFVLTYNPPKNSSWWDIFTSDKKEWQQYIKEGQFIICTSYTTGSDEDFRVFPLKPYSDRQVFKVGTLAVVSKIEKSKEGGLEITATGIAKAELWQLADPAKLHIKSPFHLAEKFGVFKSIVEDEETLRTAVRPFIALIQRLMKLGILTTDQRKQVLTALAEIPDPIQAADLDPEGMVTMLHTVMYLVCRSFVKPMRNAQQLQKMYTHTNIAYELAMFNILLKESIMAHLGKKSGEDPAKGHPGALVGPSAGTGAKGDGDENAVRRCLFEKIKIHMNLEAQQEIERVLKALEGQSKGTAPNGETSVLNRWIDNSLGLPWGVFTEDNKDLKAARQILQEGHYGMEEVKDRIIEFLAVRMEKPNSIDKIPCEVGPPGVGKTSIAKFIAKALGRKFYRISLGGVHDEADIRGHRMTYIGALPGQIMEGVRRCGSSNPLFLIDEVDKIGQDPRGDPSKALMEVFDPEQNTEFKDHYYNFPYDLSRVLFITTANIAQFIPGPLRDRMEILLIPGYFEHEKLEIAKRYLLPNQLKNTGLEGKVDVRIDDDTWRQLIAKYTFEAGVRRVDSYTNQICRRIVKRRQEDHIIEDVVTVGTDDLEKYVGEPKVHNRVAYVTNPGEVFGLSVMTNQDEGVSLGDILPLQCLLVPRDEPGKAISYTGNFKDVMRESAKNAVSCVRVFLDKNYPDKVGRLKDVIIDIGASDAAQPKDGPSAGIAFVTLLLSTVFEKPVRPFVAMTGEFDKQFRVKRVGGIKEKVLGAERAGIKEVILPKDNLPDFEKLPDVIKEKIKVHPVETLQEAIAIAFEGGLPEPKLAV